MESVVHLDELDNEEETEWWFSIEILLFPIDELFPKRAILDLWLQTLSGVLIGVAGRMTEFDGLGVLFGKLRGDLEEKGVLVTMLGRVSVGESVELEEKGVLVTMLGRVLVGESVE